MMYTDMMRRIQIYLEESVDEALQAEAARTGRSKAALIRECLAVRYGAAREPVDPIDALIGAYDIEPAIVDEVVYGHVEGSENDTGDEELVAEPPAKR